MTQSSPALALQSSDAAEAVCSTQLYQVEQDLTPVEALVRYGRTSLPFQRLAYAQGIAAAAASASYDECKQQVLPLVQDLLKDSEADIQVAVVKQLPAVGQALTAAGCGQEQQQLLDVLLSALYPQLLAEEDEVSKAAVITHQQLVALLPPAEAAQATLRTLRRLEAQHMDEASIQAVRVFAHAASSWPPQQVASYLPQQLRQWGSHRDFSVREALACCMSLIASNAPLDSWQAAILPCFQELCGDPNWRVRRAGASDLPRLAEQLQQRSEALEQQQQQDQQQQEDDPSTSAAAAEPDSKQCSDNTSGDGLSTPTKRSRLHSSSHHHQHQQRRGLHHTSTPGLGWQPLYLPSAAAAPPPPPLGTCCSGAVASRGSSPPFLSPRTLVPSSPATAPGAAAIMGSHPLRSSLIVDDVLAPHLVGRALGRPAGSSCPVGRTGNGVVLNGASSPASSSSCGRRCSSSSSSDDEGSDDGRSGAHGSSGSLGALDTPPHQQQRVCSLQQQQPVLHTCWMWLRESMELLSADSSHWVKVSALNGLGPLLLLLPRCQMSQLLVNRFLAMANSSVVVYDISVALACARSFGGMVDKLGPAAWPVLRPAFSHLQASRDPAVLQELVQALPRLARGLEPGVVAGELLPALSGLCHQHLSWLEGALAPLLGELLAALPRQGQGILLEVIPMLVAADKERCRAWRLRRTVATQLTAMAAAVPPEAVTHVLWPAAITLCKDPVAAVRAAAAAQMGGVLQALTAGALQAAAGASTSGAGVGVGGDAGAPGFGVLGRAFAAGGGAGGEGAAGEGAHMIHGASGLRRCSRGSDSGSGDDGEYLGTRMGDGSSSSGSSTHVLRSLRHSSTTESGDEGDADSDSEHHSSNSSMKAAPLATATVQVPVGGAGSSTTASSSKQLQDLRGMPIAGSPWPGRVLGGSLADEDGSSSPTYGGMQGLAHPALVVLPPKPPLGPRAAAGAAAGAMGGAAAAAAVPVAGRGFFDRAPTGYLDGYQQACAGSADAVFDEEGEGFPCALSPPEASFPVPPPPQAQRASPGLLALQQQQQQDKELLGRMQLAAPHMPARASDSDSSSSMGSQPAEQPFRSALSSPGPSPPLSPTSSSSSSASTHVSRGQQQEQQQPLDSSTSSSSSSSGSSSGSTTPEPGVQHHHRSQAQDGSGSSSSGTGRDKHPRPQRRVSFKDDGTDELPMCSTAAAITAPDATPVTLGAADGVSPLAVPPPPAAAAAAGGGVSGGAGTPPRPATTTSSSSNSGSSSPASGLIHPAMMPVGSWATRQVGSQYKRSQSAGDLSRVATGGSSSSTGTGTTSSSNNAGSSCRVGNMPRRSSTSRLMRSSTSPSGGLQRALTAAAAAKDPKHATPAQYVDTLLQSFAWSPTYQARQLFVPIALSMLANAGQQLSGGQQQQLWQALLALARDDVASVRAVLRAAVAPLLGDAVPAAGEDAPAAAHDGSCRVSQLPQQQEEQHEHQQAQQHVQSSPAPALNGVHPVTPLATVSLVTKEGSKCQQAAASCAAVGEFPSACTTGVGVGAGGEVLMQGVCCAAPAPDGWDLAGGCCSGMADGSPTSSRNGEGSTMLESSVLKLQQRQQMLELLSLLRD